MLLEDESEVRAIHREIDGKYQVCISGWGLGMYGYIVGMGFVYNDLDIESMKDNLQSMRPKLKAFKEGWNKGAVLNEARPQDVNVVVNNNVNIDISFEQAKQKIDEMPGLTETEAEEIKAKIDELEDIAKEPSTKKKKWERVKPILAFVLDKSADVAIAIMALILQMKLGM